jgi:XisI protein
MERLTEEQLDQYRNSIEQVIHYYAQFKPIVGETEREISFDRVRNHYHLFTIGWNGPQRIYGCLIHMDIRDGKIWVQYDGTETGVANDLIKMGIDKQKIVLAFQSEALRQYGDFAIV